MCATFTMANKEDGDDKINYKSISCERIPELFLDRLVAKKHFSKFGKVRRFILRPNRLSCTVEYESKEEASLGYALANNFNGYIFDIKYTEREVSHVQNTEEWVSPEVQSELEAMNHGQWMQSAKTMRPSVPKPIPPPRAIKSLATRDVKPAVVMTQTEEAAPLQKLDSSVRMELEALLRKPAFTDEDKYRVLDARDKLIRLKTVWQTDIKKAVSTKGICPDMCPEKERLMREYQRQLSIFEMSKSRPNCISHEYAIKEYSRSSADQDVPLAHELRPENVLQRTMLYMMHKIMDLCDDPQISLADWFHFVWDRTRSIRKDITQQELCSLNTVKLIEQCARFHIHCTARLVSEDPSVFDKKINAENLTKCLQSLKYMYHDLRLKNIRCPCEAEFRSYIVLLNLGDANFRWELTQLPEQIQNSAEIKQAIAFYNALQNNNYVRFFNMIRSSKTTYLSACILLGYFTKLRLKAMEVIVKSHNWRNNSVTLPLKYLKQVLGFESLKATKDFLRSHGMECNADCVMLDHLKTPDVDYNMERALTLVESKRQVSVGECINGQQLESSTIFENHRPHNSFDDNGLLKANAWNADDQQLPNALLTSRKGDAIDTQTALVAVAATSGIKTETVSRMQSSDGVNIFKVPLPSSALKQQDSRQLKVPSSSSPSLFDGNTSTPNSSKATNAFGSPSLSLKSANLFEPSHMYPPMTSSEVDSRPFNLSSFGSPSETMETEQQAQKTNTFRFSANVEENAPPTIFGGNIFASASKATSSFFAMDNIFGHRPAPERGSTSNFGGSQVATTGFRTIDGIDRRSQKSHAHDLNAKTSTEFVHETAEQLVGDLHADEDTNNFAQEQLRVLRKEEERQRRLEDLQRRVDQQRDAILETVLAEEIRRLATDELSTYQALERRTGTLMMEILDEVIVAEVEQLQREECKSMSRNGSLLRRYFVCWQQAALRKRQRRQQMESTPIWATTETRDQQTEQLRHPQENENLQMIKRYRYGEACDFTQLLLPHEVQYDVQPPVDLFQVVASQMDQRQPSSRHYFKLLITLPGDDEEMAGFENMCNRWLCKYVRRPQREVVAVTAAADTIADGVAFIADVDKDVALCVRKLTGIEARNENCERIKDEGDHADAIIVLTSGNHLSNTRRRLQRLFALSTIHKAVPVAFVVYNGHWRRPELEEQLQLGAFTNAGQMLAYEFYGYGRSRAVFNFSRHLRKAATFVARASVQPNVVDQLEMMPLSNWLECSLDEEMWRRWSHSNTLNPAFNKMCCEPQNIVELYNEAVYRLQGIASEDVVASSTELPDELRPLVPQIRTHRALGLEHFPKNWKDPNRRTAIWQLLEKLKMPNIERDMAVTGDVEKLEIFVLNYASRCIDGDEQASLVASYEAIKTLIESLNRSELQHLELAERLPFISWLLIMKPLAIARAHVLYDATGISRLPKEIIYRRQAFLAYQRNPWWLHCNAIKTVTFPGNHILTCHPAAPETVDENILDDMRAAIEHAEAISLRASEHLEAMKQQVKYAVDNDLTRKLDETFYQFDLAKKCGYMDNNVHIASNNEDSLDGADDLPNTVALEAVTETARKRGRIDETNPKSEADMVIAKALAIIRKIERAEAAHIHRGDDMIDIDYQE